jgi:hypothetical protein
MQYPNYYMESEFESNMKRFFIPIKNGGRPNVAILLRCGHSNTYLLGAV